MNYKKGEHVQVDMNRYCHGNTGGEVADAVVISDNGDTVTATIRSFCGTNENAVVSKKAIL